MDSACRTHDLPSLATHDDCAALRRFLDAARGHPVRLGGSGVRRTGALMAQLLLAARRAWVADGIAFEIANPSDALVRGISRLGLAADLLDGGAAA